MDNNYSSCGQEVVYASMPEASKIARLISNQLVSNKCLVSSECLALIGDQAYHMGPCVQSVG